MKFKLFSRTDRTEKVRLSCKSFVSHHVAGENGAPTFNECYKLQEKLDTFSNTHQCLHKGSGEVRSVQILLKDKVAKNDFFTEVQILRELDHPSLLNLFESFEDDEHYYLVTNSLQHDTLLEAVANMKDEKFGKAHVAHIIATLLELLNICHNHKISGYQISHGAIHPTNILVPEGQGFSNLMLVGFDNAVMRVPSTAADKNNTDDSETDEERTQKPSIFSSPEFASEGPTPQGDIFSVGVLTYLLFTGKFPFEKASDLKDKGIQKWRNIKNKDTKTFIKHCLQFDPKKRPTAYHAYDYDWMAHGNKVKAQVDSDVTEEVLGRLVEQTKQHKLQQAVSSYIATNLLHKTERADLDLLFQQADRNCDGVLTKGEVKRLLEDKLNVRLQPDDVDKIFATLSVNGDDAIDHSEFLAAAAGFELLLEEDHLKAAFEAFDRSNTGFINREDLKELFNNSGYGGNEAGMVDDKTAKALIQLADTAGDGKISYEEFKQMMGCK